MNGPLARIARFRSFCQIFLVSLLVGLTGSTSPVRSDSWIPVGAPGGNVRALAADPRHPDRIYLGTADGILYRSDDGGADWQRLDPGFPRRGCSLDEITVDPRGRVFVGYWEVHGSGGGVARSNDGGRTFAILKGVEGESVRALALAPSDPRVVAAGTLSGVFLSRDLGMTWARITPKGHPDLRNIESLAFDPTDPNVLYAGTWHLAWKTADAGADWAPVHQGMIDDSDVMTLTTDPTNPRTVYATACTGIYRSLDGGGAWTKLRGIPFSSRRTRAFARGKDDANLLLAGTTEGLWVSENNGASWRCTTSRELVVNDVVAQADGTILLGTEEAGVLRSADHGRTWNPSNKGFSERFVFKLLFDDDSNRLIVAIWGATRYGGVFVSPGIEGPWARLGNGLDGRQVTALALQGKTILAGTDDGIFARAPEATAWTRLKTLVEGKEAHPRVSELVAMPSGQLVAATARGILCSPDGGRTWTQVLDASGEIADLAVSPLNPDLLVAVSKSGCLRSDDGGEHWTQASSAWTVSPHSVAFMPANDRVLFATTTAGLYRSTDQGASWRRVNGGLPHSDLTGIAVSPDGRTLYVSDFTWGGIFRSANGGGTWDRMPTDGLGSDRVWAVGVDPAAPDRVLAAPSAGGLHVLNAGASLGAKAD